MWIPCTAACCDFSICILDSTIYEPDALFTSIRARENYQAILLEEMVGPSNQSFMLASIRQTQHTLVNTTRAKESQDAFNIGGCNHVFLLCVGIL
jgi:hypothetical protein